MLIDLSDHDLQMVIEAVQHVAFGDDLFDNGWSASEQDFAELAKRIQEQAVP
jgi:hypothetical protein